MTITEFYEDVEIQKYLKIQSKMVYYQNVFYLIRKNYEYEEFANEVNIYIIKYMDNYDEMYSLKNWICMMVKSVAKDLLKRINAQKNGELMDDNIYHLDHDVNTENVDSNNTEIIHVFAPSDFNIHEYVNFVINNISNKIDKQVCELYLFGYQMTTIARMLNLTLRQVRYKINVKYNDLFKESYFEYKANTI